MIFVDSNLWLYVYLSDQDPRKRGLVLARLSSMNDVAISTQVMVEVGANLIKKAHAPESRVLSVILEMERECCLHVVRGSTLVEASRLRSNGSWSYWDSLIVAAALESGCAELWSEDLQHGQVIDGRLRIVNPLIPST